MQQDRSSDQVIHFNFFVVIATSNLPHCAIVTVVVRRGRLICLLVSSSTQDYLVVSLHMIPGFQFFLSSTCLAGSTDVMSPYRVLASAAITCSPLDRLID